MHLYLRIIWHLSSDEDNQCIACSITYHYYLPILYHLNTKCKSISIMVAEYKSILENSHIGFFSQFHCIYLQDYIQSF